MKNIHIYWDDSRGIVGVTMGHIGGVEMRYEEPSNGRVALCDDEILSMVDAALSAVRRGD